MNNPCNVFSYQELHQDTQKSKQCTTNKCETKMRLCFWDMGDLKTKIGMLSC